MRPPLRRMRRAWIPWFVLFVSLTLTLLSAWAASRSITARERMRFQGLASATQVSIERRLETYTNVLRATGAFFVANGGTMEPEEFRAYVGSLEVQKRYPGIQGIGFTQRFRTAERQQVIDAMHQRGLDWFRTWPEPTGDEFHAIMHLEPVDRRNRAAIGYDMYSEPVRRAAMARARDTGRPAISGRVTLVQEIELRKQPGFLLYVPVYEGGGMPATLQQRREQLVGFFYSPFRAHDLLHGIVNPEMAGAIGFEIFDGYNPTPPALLYRTPFDPRGGKFTTTRRSIVSGRPWTLVFHSGHLAESEADRARVPGILIGGFLVSGILFGLTRAQARARAEAESAAAELRASEALLRESESRLRRLVEANIIGITISESTGAITEANDAFLEMIGYTRDDLRRGAIRAADLTPAEYREKDRLAVEEMIRTGRHAPYEKVYIRRDGTRVPVLIGRALLSTESNRAVGFVLDLSERKEIEEQLRDRTQILETVNRVGRLLSAELDLQKVVQGVTDAATELTGAEAGAFFYNTTTSEGESWRLYALSGMSRDVFSGLPMPRITKLFGPVFHGEELMRMDDVSLDSRFGRNEPFQGLPPGHPPVRSFLAAPVMSRSGQVIGALLFGHRLPGVFGDREEQIARGLASQAAVAVDNARLYEAAHRDRQHAEDANRAKDEFLATLSHELRTPMTAILGWARLMELGGMNKEETTAAIEAIARSARAQAQLIDDLLDVSRITTGKLRMEQKQIDIVTVFAEAINAIRPVAAAKGITVNVETPDAPLRVRGDAQRLQQIIWNLLTNAVKFTPAGGRVDALLEREGEAVHLRIRDTGQGIDPAFLPLVFERFRQADATATRQHGGLGIGLSIVRYLTELHGGTVLASSEGRGKGATFEVRLPLDLTVDAGATVVERSERLPLLQGKRILVIEDESEVRAFIGAAIVSGGAAVEYATSAAEAIDAFHRRMYDAVVSDIAMPGEDGCSLMRKIRSGDWNSGVPAVAVTAFGRTEDRERIMAAGFDAFLHKPIDPQVLLGTIGDVIARARA